MRQTSTATDVLDSPNAPWDEAGGPRGGGSLVPRPPRPDPRWAKWVVPGILLVLVPVLIAVAFSSPSRGAWSVTDSVLFILTALLCTLVAASLTLSWCSPWLTRIEQSLAPMAARLDALQGTQVRLGETVQQSTRQVSARTAQEEGNQRSLQEGMARLADRLQTVASHMAALGEALQTHREATKTAIGTLAAGQGQLTGDVRTLQELTRTVADSATDAVREQAAIRAVLQDSTQAVTSVTEAVHRGQDTLQTKLENVAEGGRQTMASVTTVLEIQERIRRMMEEVTGLGTSQIPFGEALRAHGDVINMAVAALAASEERLTHDVRQLHEFTRALAGGITDVAREQAAAHGALQQALSGTTEIIHQGHSTVQTKLEDLAGTGRQTIEAVTAIAADQRTAQETAQRTMEEITGLGTRHAALAETLQAQREALDTGIAALTNGQGQLTGDLRQLHELTQTVAGGVTDAAREQAAAHGALQQALSGTTETMHQGHHALQTKLEDLAGTGRQTIEAVTTIAAGQTALHETARHVMEEVNGVAARQTALGEAVQAHREATNAGVSALLNGQGQLTGDLRQLHGLTQTVAGGVTDAAREQAAAQGALQQALSGTTETMHQGHHALQTRLEDLAGTGRQTIEAVTTIAAEQTALHETARHVMEEVNGVAARQTALGEAVQAHREATNAGVSALLNGQGQLTGDLRQLHELTQTVTGGVTDAALEQAAAHSALQDRARDLTAATDAIQQNQRALRIELEKLADSTAQTIEAVHAVAVGQTTGREATRRMISELANAAITALSTGHASWPRTDRPLEALVRTVTGGGPLNIELPAPAEETRTSPRLPAAHAIIHGEQMRYEVGPDRDNLGCWADPRDWAEWELDVTRPGRFKVTAEIAALAASRFQVILGDQGLDGNAPRTGDYGRFQKVEIGTVELPAAGKTRVAVRPIPEGWQPMNLRSVELAPIPAED